jgi:hypothetical protein
VTLLSSVFSHMASFYPKRLCLGHSAHPSRRPLDSPSSRVQLDSTLLVRSRLLLVPRLLRAPATFHIPVRIPRILCDRSVRFSR